jgi:glycerate 2-kinase
MSHRQIQRELSTMSPRRDAEAIWRAGVAAVDSSALVRQSVRCRASTLDVCGESFELDRLERILVVGAGKAGAGMALGLETALGSRLLDTKVEGWINVPANCVRPLHRIHLHAARPAGVNEPTAEGVAGSERILERVASLSEHDLCLVLISGGGSALLPLPIDDITLADKLAVTRYLSRTGATIHELNTVRKRLSRIKGGGLLRAANAGRMISLIISDVIGDPLDIIASGPTLCDEGTAHEALAVLNRLSSASSSTSNASLIPPSVWSALQKQSAQQSQQPAPRITCRNCIIGNNDTALNAAVTQAQALGYEVRSLGTGRSGLARDLGVELAELSLAARRERSSQPICFIGGGEPVVKLAPTDRPRLGGRNQELALAALCHFERGHREQDPLTGIAILSGGTDGEDGPTDAAGAICDQAVRDAARLKQLNPEPFLAINDSYTFFQQTNGLLKTGPTHTNVMDLQVAVVHPVT